MHDASARQYNPRGASALRWLAFSACDLGCECLEPVHPEMTEVIEPGVDLLQRRGVDRVDATRTVGPNRGKSALPQYLEVLRYGGLRDAKLLVNDRNQIARRGLANCKHFQDASPDRIAQDIEGMHAGYFSDAAAPL